ncbi:hypothetical protein ACJ72_08256 [Emergomyces africanus]|uniref:Peptidase A1 domain-containing protein n=1 Tax=Emergomyces africanus TaxID=1955775 RepID=A0A1B7NKY3_9EURO|nr:hypothetical protein ACJ72_08256 [Emergomyces africanus]
MSILGFPAPGEVHIINLKIAGINFRMLFDTGSADFWVLSSEIPIHRRRSHAGYVPTRTKELRGSSFRAQYLDGCTAEGKVYLDSVTLGLMTLTGQAFGVASNATDDFFDRLPDGVLGMSFDSISSIKPRVTGMSFWDNLKKELARPIFAVALKRGKTGTIDFGYTNGHNYLGRLAYLPVDPRRKFWAINVFGLEVLSTRLMSSYSALIDTGSTMIKLPPEDVRTYYRHVPQARKDEQNGYWYFPCGTILPDMKLLLATYKARIWGDFMNLGYYSRERRLCLGAVQECTDGRYFILGAAFLHTHYVVFEPEIPRIGIATLVNP